MIIRLLLVALFLICSIPSLASDQVSENGTYAPSSHQFNIPVYKLITATLLGLYELNHIVSTYSSDAVNGYLPAVALRMGKGDLSELISTKTLCGTMIFAGKAMSQLLQETGIPWGGPLLSVVFLVPTLYQHNQPFKYDQADLQVAFTIYSAKTAIKLLEDEFKKQACPNLQTGATLITLAIPIWALGMSNGQIAVAYLWFALPKLMISSGLAETYKGIQPSGNPGPLFSGGMAYISGKMMSQGIAAGIIPEYAGLTASVAGKMKKLLGYGLADSTVKFIRDTDLIPRGLKRPITYTLLYYATVAADKMVRLNMYPELFASIRRGLVVKFVLFKIENSLLLGCWVLPLIFEPPVYSLSESGLSTDPESVVGDQDHFCLITPVAGMATSTYQYNCYEINEQGMDEIPFLADMEWLLLFFVL